MTAPKVERPAGVAPVRQDALPPAFTFGRRVISSVSLSVSFSFSPSSSRAADGQRPTVSARGGHFLIARQQIDLKLYDQAIDTLRKATQDSHPQTAIDASFSDCIGP